MKNYTTFGHHRSLKHMLPRWCVVLLLLLNTAVQAQQIPKTQKAALDTCYASTEVYHTKVYPELADLRQQFEGSIALAAPPVKTANIEVTFTGFTPEAQAAFQYAVDIWSTIIVSPVTIRLFASFEPLGPGVLGSAGASSIHSDFSNKAKPGVWYVDALADAIAGKDLLPDPNEPDIIARFSSSFNWYYGTDMNPASNQFDFVSVVLHEIGHGLGFTGATFFDTDTEEGFIRILDMPVIYNDFVVNGNGTPILSFDDPSVELGEQFTSDNLFMNGKYAVANLGKKPKIYAPTTWRQGSSYSHWDEATFPAGDINSLMTPQFGFAESNHNVGPITRGLFRDMGWQLNHGKTTLISLRQTVQPSGGADCGSLPVPTTDRITVLPNTEVCYYYTVKNEGDITLNLHDLMDDRNGVILDDKAIKLTPGASATVFASETIQKTSVTNVATWTAFNPGPESKVMASGVTNVDVFIPPVASVEPEVLLEALPVAGMSKKKLTLKNEGEGSLEYKVVIREFEAPIEELIKSSGEAVQQSLKTKELPDRNSFSNIKVPAKGGQESARAIMGGGEDLKVLEYYTDFQNFKLGDLFGQDGWTNSPGYIISLNPFNNNKFLQAVSNGAGGTTLAFSPNVGSGNEPFSSFATTVNIVGQGTTFEIIPQSPGAGSVVTRIVFATNGYIYLLIPEFGFVNTGIPIPKGTFDLQMVVDRTNFDYSLSINGELIFTGIPGFAGDIEEVVLLSFNEADGPVMNIDNFVILDGDMDAPDWVTVDPSVGQVAPYSASAINVFFDASGLKEGVYFADIFILNNDPENPLIDVPVALLVEGEKAAFNLIDAAADQVISPLKNGDVIHVDADTPPLNIQALPMQPQVGSVVFKLNGKSIMTENEVPYAAFGDINGDYAEWFPEPGMYELIAIPYSKPQAKGTKYPSQKVTFTVTKQMVEDLRLISICTSNPDELRKWKVVNPNNFDIKIGWLLADSDQYGSLTVAPGRTFFVTETVAGPNTMIIVWENEKGETQELEVTSDGYKCGEEPTVIAEINAYPNPISERLEVTINGEVGETFSLSIVNQQSGKVYINNNFTIKKVGVPFELNTINLPKGTHILMVESGQAKELVRIVKE